MASFFGIGNTKVAPDVSGEIKKEEAYKVSESFEKEIENADLDILDRTQFNEKMMGRRTKGALAKSCIIYPDDKFRSRWDFIVSM